MITAKDAKKMTQDNVAERDEVITHRIEESVLAAVKQCRFYANVYTCKGISADPAQVAEVIKSCGFQNRRAKLIVEFSQAWIDWPEDTPISKYSGCGKYAEDSYKIFVDKDYTCQPADKELKKYLQNRWPQNCEECQYKMECMDMGDCAYY